MNDIVLGQQRKTIEDMEDMLHCDRETTYRELRKRDNSLLEVTKRLEEQGKELAQMREKEKWERGVKNGGLDKESRTRAKDKIKEALDEMRERRRGIEDERDKLKSKIEELRKSGEAGRTEIERMKVELRIVRVDNEKAKKIVKERLVRTERELMSSQKQLSDLRDKMNEYERRFGNLEDIRKEEKER